MNNFTRLSPSELVATAMCLVTITVCDRADAQTADGDDRLDEIIVTAQRREERIEDVPMSLVAISPDAMQKAGVTGLTDLAQLAPGVQINYGGNSMQPAIRGITTLTTGNGVENNVAIYVDGFYETSTTAINSELLNIAGIEVLKGPQGTLYGRNATGGAILINTLAPSDVWTGKFQGKYGKFDDRTVSGYLSGPLSSSIRFAVGGFYRKSDGWVKLVSPTAVGETAGDAAPIEQAGIRTKLEVEFSENVQSTLAYNYGYTDDPHTVLFSTFDHVPPTLPPPPSRISEFGSAASNYRSKQETKSNQVTLKTSVDTGIGKLNLYTGYTQHRDHGLLDADGSYVDLSSLELLLDLKTYQQAVDLTIDTIDKLTLVIGGLYYGDKFDGNNSTGVAIRGGNGALLLTNRPTLKTNAWAAYADASYQITDRLNLDLGGRYSSDEKKFTFSSQGASGAFFLPETNRQATFSEFTPRAALRFEIAPRTNVYASWSQGFRSGSFNPSGASTAALLLPIEPEKITAYEIGLKTARSTFRFDVAGFYYDYKDINVSIIIPNPTCPVGQTCPNVNVFGNAPGAKVYGMDGQANWQALDDLNLRLGVAWLHARYDAFPNATGTGLNPATNLNVSGQVQDWSGQQMARAPDVTINGGFDYSALFTIGKVVFSSSVSYSDSYVVNNASLFGPLAGSQAGTQRYRQGSLTLINAQINWTDPSDHYAIGLFGNNLTNKRYFDTYTGSAFGDYGAVAKPRTYGITLGYQF